MYLSRQKWRKTVIPDFVWFPRGSVALIEIAVVCLCACKNDGKLQQRWEMESIHCHHHPHAVWLHFRPTAPPPLPLLSRLVTSCYHHHPSPLYPLTHVCLPVFSLFLLSLFCCHYIKTLVGLFVSVWPWQQKALEEEMWGNKYLKGEGTQLSQKCRNRHSIPPSEANVSKARGLVFVFSSGALWVVY